MMKIEKQNGIYGSRRRVLDIVGLGRWVGIELN
jgi:hypothetical protein